MDVSNRLSGVSSAQSNALGVKGLGELGICGAGAAVANAVYNATGVRVRHFPMTLDTAEVAKLIIEAAKAATPS